MKTMHIRTPTALLRITLQDMVYAWRSRHITWFRVRRHDIRAAFTFISDVPDGILTLALARTGKIRSSGVMESFEKNLVLLRGH